MSIVEIIELLGPNWPWKIENNHVVFAPINSNDRLMSGSHSELDHIFRVCNTLDRPLALEYLNELKNAKETAQILKLVDNDTAVAYKHDINKAIHQTFIQTHFEKYNEPNIWMFGYLDDNLLYDPQNPNSQYKV